MSMLLMVKAMQLKVGNPLRKLVLIKLADNASDSGECWPSYQHIADQCEISKRSVISHVNKLVEMGIVSITHREGPKGNSSNVYKLTIPNHVGGAGDSLGVVQEIHHLGAGDSLGGGAGDAPRTSHSFESVKEPVVGTTSSKLNVPLQQVLDAYHSILPQMAKVQIFSDKRKTLVKNFLRKRQKEHAEAGKVYGIDNIRVYLTYIAQNCQWMLEDRPNGKGGFWKAKNFDYVFKDDCYIAVKEQRYDQRGAA